MESPSKYDIVVLGGGIVGLATATTLLEKFPNLHIAVLEKENQLAFHQTGRNSGVIHSGVYYKPGSLKASLCLSGSRALIELCRREKIRYEICGKLIVAASTEEIPRLEELHRRAQANGVPGCRLLGPEEIRELEPNAVGIQALHVPTAGIVDYKEVTRAYARMIESRGGVIRTGTLFRKTVSENGGLRVITDRESFFSRFLINCGGLQSDRIARSSSRENHLKIIPFRGEYYELVPEKRHLVRSLIYPVPDPRFPFLGVHFTRRIDGRVDAGPNAVLALKREGYRRTDVNWADMADMATFPGFWKMAAKHWKTGLQETIRSFNKKIFVRDLQRLVPAIKESDLIPSESGVRAQAVDRSGALLDDFHIVQSNRMIHVCNAPSPAATASLAIGEYVVNAAARQFGFKVSK